MITYWLRKNSTYIAWAAALAFIIWAPFTFWWDNFSLQVRWFVMDFIWRGHFAATWNILHITPWAMLLIAVILAAGWFGVDFYRQVVHDVDVREAEKVAYEARRETEDFTIQPVEVPEPDGPKLYLLAVPIVMVVLSVSFFISGLNDRASSYAPSTTFVVSDANTPPRSLSQLVKGAVPSKDCALLADHGMPGCVVEGDFVGDWYPRNASATGAKVILGNTSGTVSNTEILNDTLSYVYDDKGDGQWTVIRDGKSTQSIYGVVSWDGDGPTAECLFDGDYALDQAFGGHGWNNNLSNTIAKAYPTLFYDDTDRWGYCDGDKPVVVIPVKQMKNFAHRVTFRAAGVLVITGSPSGQPKIVHDADVTAGEYGGPVYSQSLVDEQRESVGMMSGWWNNHNEKFGYEPLSSDTQRGNNTDYLLRSRADDHLYWVTPLRPRGSDSQQIVAYSVIRADETTPGQLNEQRVYVFDNDDPRIIDLNSMESRVRASLAVDVPGFVPNGGELIEFLPLNDETWQVYGELDGRVAYRITVPTDASIRPRVTVLDPSVESPPIGGETPTPPASAGVCDGELGELSDAQLTSCLSQMIESQLRLVRELESRSGS